MLADRLESLAIPFASSHDEVSDADGMQCPEFFMDYAHLGQTAMPLAVRALAKVLGQGYFESYCPCLES